MNENYVINLENILNRLTWIEKNALKDIQTVLTKKYRNNLILLKLFGSKARGDSQSFSDIDLLAVVEKDSWKASDKMSDDVFEVIEKYNYELLISLIVLDYDEYSKVKTCFYENIERDGIDLWKRD